MSVFALLPYIKAYGKPPCFVNGREEHGNSNGLAIKTAQTASCNIKLMVRACSRFWEHWIFLFPNQAMLFLTNT
jgi:hypothetical protein